MKSSDFIAGWVSVPLLELSLASPLLDWLYPASIAGPDSGIGTGDIGAGFA